MLDADHFKRVNDEYGHSAGDLVLKELADIIKRQRTKQLTFCYRYGGEEFLVVLDQNRHLPGANGLRSD